MVTVGEIYDLIDEIAPFSLTQKGDNTGVLIGDKANKVTKILLALDITNEVAIEALKVGAELIISHHPIIYNPLYTISNENPVAILMKNNISAICAHTNLDMARGGINDIIVEKLGLRLIEPTVETVHNMPFYQISVFVPIEKADEVITAMSIAGAGKLGNYERCAFSVQGEGTFIPLEGSNAYIGEIGNKEQVREVRIEMIVPPFKKKKVIQAMFDAHPYEKPAYTLVENYAIMEKYGYGKVCVLDKQITAKDLATKIKEVFGNSVVRYNDTGKLIKTLAICSGGSGNLVKNVINLGVDAYIAGDIKHDNFIDAQNAGLIVFDAGHYHTENIVLDYLLDVIMKKYSKMDVSIATTNRDILSYEK